MENTLAVIGAGTMGAGIAQVVAMHGWQVRLIDVNASVLSSAITGLQKRFQRLVEKGKLSKEIGLQAFQRITAQDTITNLKDTRLAIEAIVENLDVKRKVFADLEAAVSSSTILASNTSSLSIAAIAKGAKHPERVVGMHFFNPAPLMPLVEIIAATTSNSQSVDDAYDIAKTWQKTPVRAKDTPGFIVNRVARGFYLEALRLLGEGVASVSEIDLVMRTHGQFRMGPFELMDLVGLDVNLAVSTSVYEQMDRHPRFAPHDIQKNLVDQAHLGRKTGRGFYCYDGDTPLPALHAERKSFDLSPLLRDAITVFTHKAGLSDAGSTEQYIFARILGAVINEAGLAFSADVASADDIDIAMQKGTNYPQGPLAWADRIGHRNVRGLLRSLQDHVTDARYEAADLFAQAQ